MVVTVVTIVQADLVGLVVTVVQPDLIVMIVTADLVVITVYCC